MKDCASVGGQGYYKDKKKFAHTGICSKCHDNCLTCNGPEETDCIQCRHGFYDGGAVKGCQECSAMCDGCTGPTWKDCVKCAAKHWKHGKSECYEKDMCPEGTFNLIDNDPAKEDVCAACPEGCKECKYLHYGKSFIFIPLSNLSFLAFEAASSINGNVETP